MSSNNQPTEIGRRTVIVTAGGVVLTGLGSGVASAGKGGKGKGQGQGGGNGGNPGKNTCPEGTVLLAKYEVKDGKFVFEKDGNYLDVGDSFEFTIDATKDGNEVLAFTVEDPSGVYNINALSVKTGEGVFQKTGGGGTSLSFDARNYDEGGPVQAVSNVLICAEVFWQLDFGKGDVPIPPRYSEGGLDNLVMAATGNSSTEDVVNPFRDFDDDRDYVDADPAFSIDFSAGTATIGFENNTANERLHLASFKTPGPLRPSEGFPEIESQELFQANYTTATSGSLTVDIPTPGDFS